MKHHLPSPTVWPAALALGAMLVALGGITSMLVSLAGAVVAAWALISWIRLLLAEGEDHP